MKKTVKLLSLVLALFCILTALPLTAFAETSLEANDTTPAYLDGAKLLLEVPNLATDVENTVDGVKYTYTDDNVFKRGDYCIPDGDKIIVDPTTNGSGAAWSAYIGKTNLPLNANSKYIITFEAAFNSVADRSCFTISALNSEVNACSVGMTESGNKVSFFTRHNIAKETTISNVIDVDAMNPYAIIIDGYNISLVVKNAYIATFNVADVTGYTQNIDYLCLGTYVRLDDRTPSTVLSEIKDIRVYSGQSAFKLFHLDNMKYMMEPFAENATVDGIRFTDENNHRLQVNQDSGAITINTTEVNTNLECATGFDTNLPLNSNTPYTVEMYIDNGADSSELGVVFDWWNYANMSAIGFKRDSVGYKPKGQRTFTDINTVPNVWTKHQNNGGYTHIVLQINGYEVTAFVGGKAVGTHTFTTYNNAVLGLGIMMRLDTNKYNDPSVEYVANVQDINVYAGIVDIDKKIELVNGETVTSYDKKVGDVITEFPTVECAEDEVAVWFNKNTNAFVKAPYKVTADATIEAEVLKKTSASAIVGIQYTEKDSNNRQQIRVIANLYALDGISTGFDVTAYYKSGDTVKSQEWLGVESTYVYGAIGVKEESGTVKKVTAEELGGEYLSAIGIGEIPTSIGQIDFYITSYVTVKGADGSLTKVYGKQQVYSLYDGEPNNGGTLIAVPTSAN